MTQTFHSLDAMATEYRANAALLEERESAC